METVDFNLLDPEMLPILLEVDFVNAYFMTFPPFAGAFDRFWRRRVAARFGRARREGSDVEDFDRVRGFLILLRIRLLKLRRVDLVPLAACLQDGVRRHRSRGAGRRLRRFETCTPRS